MYYIYFKNPKNQYEECRTEFISSSQDIDQESVLQSLRLVLDALNYDIRDTPFLKDDIVEYGPELSFETPWCSIKDIFKNCELNIIKRIEKSKRKN